jgi:hypothetical protein
MMVPKPFSRVLLRFGKLIQIPKDATDEDLVRYSEELQATLDRVCEFADSNVSKVGTTDFHIMQEQSMKGIQNFRL